MNTVLATRMIGGSGSTRVTRLAQPDHWRVGEESGGEPGVIAYLGQPIRVCLWFAKAHDHHQCQQTGIVARFSESTKTHIYSTQVSFPGLQTLAEFGEKWGFARFRRISCLSLVQT